MKELNLIDEKMHALVVHHYLNWLFRFYQHVTLSEEKCLMDDDSTQSSQSESGVALLGEH